MYLRITDEHIRVKCGIDALQYIVFQKHLLVYTVIIFCLSIGIVLPVNYSGKNGKQRSCQNLEGVQKDQWAMINIIIGRGEIYQDGGYILFLKLATGGG